MCPKQLWISEFYQLWSRYLIMSVFFTVMDLRSHSLQSVPPKGPFTVNACICDCFIQLFNVNSSIEDNNTHLLVSARHLCIFR